MFSELFLRFCFLWSRKSAKDGLSNFGSLLCGLGAIGAYLSVDGTISSQVANVFAGLAFAGGGLTAWTTGKSDNLGL